MATRYYEKTEVKTFGTDGAWTKTTVDGKRVYEQTTDVGVATVNFKDGGVQTHNGKTGTRLIWDPVNKTLEVEEVV